MESTTAVTVAALAAAALAAAALAGCDHATPEKKPLTPVRVQPAATRDRGAALRYSASIAPAKQVQLAFKVSGYLRDLLQRPGADGQGRDVQEGDAVSAGTVLARVDPQPYVDKVNEAKAQLAAAKAALQKATADWHRAQRLFATQSITAPEHERAQKDYETARAQVDGAQAQLDTATLNLQYCDLTAPTDGVVLQRNVEVGSLVGPDTVGFVLADVSSVKAVFGVPDTVLSHLQLGSPLSVTTASIPQTEFPGRITAISPAASAQSRVFDVEVTVPNPQNALKVGMIASLNVAKGEPMAPVPVVPLTAVVRSPTDPAGYAVFVVEEQGDQSIAHLHEVQLGGVFGDAIAVTSGIKPADKIIITGATLVHDGDAVQVIP